MTSDDVLVVNVKYKGKKMRFDSIGEDARKDYNRLMKALADEKDSKSEDYTQSS